MSQYICPICLAGLEKWTRYCPKCKHDILPIPTPSKDEKNETPV